jgi:hypothetical protein
LYCVKSSDTNCAGFANDITGKVACVIEKFSLVILMFKFLSALISVDILSKPEVASNVCVTNPSPLTTILVILYEFISDVCIE